MIKAGFIGGTGRSGTNILRSLLAHSPSVSSPAFETRYTVDPRGILPTIRILDGRHSPFVIDEVLRRHFEFVKDLGKRNSVASTLNKLIRMIPGNERELYLTGIPYADWDLESHFPGYEARLAEYIHEFSSGFYNAVRPGYSAFSVKPKMVYLGLSERMLIRRAAAKFIAGNISAAMTSMSAKMYVEDNTFNLIYAGILADMLPASKFIHVRRNPLDVVASYCRQRWCPRSVLQSATIVSDLLSDMEEELSVLREDRVLTVTLEGVLRNPEPSMRRICKFLEIDFDSRMGQVDPGKGNMKRFEKELSSMEIQMSRDILGAHIKSFEQLEVGGI